MGQYTLTAVAAVRLAAHFSHHRLAAHRRVEQVLKRSPSDSERDFLAPVRQFVVRAYLGSHDLDLMVVARGLNLVDLLVRVNVVALDAMKLGDLQAAPCIHIDEAHVVRSEGRDEDGGRLEIFEPRLPLDKLKNFSSDLHHLKECKHCACLGFSELQIEGGLWRVLKEIQIHLNDAVQDFAFGR